MAEANDPRGEEIPNDGEDTARPENGTSVTQIIEVVADRVDPLLKLATAFFEKSLASQRETAKFRWRMSWIAFLVVFIIVATSASLTYMDKLDGATFAFLLGLVLGYVLTFVRDAIGPSRP